MLQLTPDRPSEIPLMPEKNSDITKEAELVQDLKDPLNIPPNAITIMRVKTGIYTVNVSVNTIKKADRLMVTFQGARGGGKDTPNSRRPMFGRRNWEGLFQCPILAISDPQTEMEWGSHLPRVGMYAGTFKDDLVPEVNALIDKFATELGIPLNRVVMYGSSAGGTSAMLVGARRKSPTGVIAVVPFLRPEKYRDEVVAITAQAAGGDIADWNNTLTNAPWRFNPLIAVKDSIADGNDLRVVVAQNTKDKVTINRHFAGLWRRFDIDPQGGISPDGRVMAVMFESADAGHGHEPPEFSRPLIKMAYEFFDTPAGQLADANAKNRSKSAKPIEAEDEETADADD
jgi:hypothetical protein